MPTEPVTADKPVPPAPWKSEAQRRTEQLTKARPIPRAAPLGQMKPGESAPGQVLDPLQASIEIFDLKRRLTLLEEFVGLRKEAPKPVESKVEKPSAAEMPTMEDQPAAK